MGFPKLIGFSLTFPRSPRKFKSRLEILHYVKSVQTRGYFWSAFFCIWTEYLFTPYFSVFTPNTGKYRPEITPYLNTFQAMLNIGKSWAKKYFTDRRTGNIIHGFRDWVLVRKTHGCYQNPQKFQATFRIEAMQGD